MKLKSKYTFVLIFFHLSFAYGQAPEPFDASPAWEDLTSDWNMIYPGDDTQCIYQDPYAFFVKPDNPEKVVISFPGGGTCWSGLTCSNEPTGRLDMGPKTVTVEDTPINAGIFLDDPKNPFYEYSHLHVGYCTGDMHVGDGTLSNDSPLPENQYSELLHFNGYNNAMSAIDWLFQNNNQIKTLVISGSTSGSYGTPFYVHLIKERFPELEIFHLGDGIGAIQIPEHTRGWLQVWNAEQVFLNYPEFFNQLPNNYHLNDIMVAAGKANPELTFTQIISSHDRVFAEMASYLGREEPVNDIILDGQTYLKSNLENLDTFTLGGDSHVNALGYYFSVNNPGNGNRGLPFTYDRFYGLGIGGISFSQWIKSIVEGTPLGSLSCNDCSAPDVQELGRYPLPIEAP